MNTDNITANEDSGEWVKQATATLKRWVRGVPPEACYTTCTCRKHVGGRHGQQTPPLAKPSQAGQLHTAMAAQGWSRRKIGAVMDFAAAWED